VLNGNRYVQNLILWRWSSRILTFLLWPFVNSSATFFTAVITRHVVEVQRLPAEILFSFLSRVMQTEGVWEQGVEENIWTWREAGEDCIMRSFITCTLHQIFLRWSYQGGWSIKLTTHRRIVLRSKNAWSYTSTPSIRLHGVVLRAQGQLYFHLCLLFPESKIPSFTPVQNKCQR
jgi:hypothetical protein